MACTVFVNGRGLAHQTSNGMSVVFPDVCKTPTSAGPIPIPYPNIGQSSDTTGGPTTVTADGSMPMVKGATYVKSSGDEAGTAGGVVSSKFQGACEFMLYSFDVTLDGQNACRLGDPLFHNDKNTMG